MGTPHSPRGWGTHGRRRWGAMALTQANPQRRAVSLGGRKSFCSPLPAPMSHSQRPGRAHSPLTATCLQAPSSSPMSSPWPSRASHCSTSSSPSASACAGAASGCGQPSRPTWAAWVGAPRDPHLQLLGSGGLRLHVPRVFAGCSLVNASARLVVQNLEGPSREGAGVPGTQVPEGGIRHDGGGRGLPQRWSAAD